MLEVTANFRSLKPIIDHLNACFEPVFAKPSQPRYVALASTLIDASLTLPRVARFTIEIETSGRIYAETFREAEAERVADICAALIGNVSISRPDKTRRPLCAGDIALLSPGHTELWRYERALEQRGIAVSSQAGQTLMRRQETQDVLALLRVLADSSDTLAFGALMRGPLVGLSEQDLLDITAQLSSNGNGHNFFTVRTDPELVQHPVAREVLLELQRLRRRASIVTPSMILAEAVERLNVRVIVAARHGSRNARALANLDALIERARSYAVAGLRAFVRDLQNDWERRTRAPEGRLDAADHAVEIVTIHSAKGLEWPVVIPVNSTTELYRPDQFVHRQSDNSLHWMLGGSLRRSWPLRVRRKAWRMPVSGSGYGMWRARARGSFCCFPIYLRHPRIPGSAPSIFASATFRSSISRHSDRWTPSNPPPQRMSSRPKNLLPNSAWSRRQHRRSSGSGRASMTATISPTHSTGSSFWRTMLNVLRLPAPGRAAG
ncbi:MULTISPECIES: 3'-5' exonuclease [Sinorhizobium]|uniref:3'-5' exonuclease n=1 Tax=Sinorhizobium TaxID=28105 RepID=UPI000424D8C8|nr:MULTISPECIES: 3'-5' exonuclease [Sinorhizobium]WOS67085.1 3'-5' exonuclease [Sinorhizobium fredii GR64]